MTLTSCGICDAAFSAMREHCPVCGSRRAFMCSHSFEPYRVVITARDAQRLEVEVVRAFSTTFCSDERACLQADLEAE